VNMNTACEKCCVGGMVCKRLFNPMCGLCLIDKNRLVRPKQECDVLRSGDK